jgi:hypothetical protein
MFGLPPPMVVKEALNTISQTTTELKGLKTVIKIICISKLTLL